jgi:hypothetical protein
MPDLCRTARFAVLGLALLPLASSAQVVPDQEDPLNAFAVLDPRLRPPASGAAELDPGARAGWDGFLAGAGGPWKGYVDRLTGHIDVAEGAGIPWLTGGGKADLPRLEATARAFLPRVSRMLGIEPASLKLSPARSGQVADHLWLVDFDIQLDGLAVEGARVVFRINNGNLIQFGTENLPTPGARAPQAAIGRKEALSILSDHIGGFSALDTFVDGGTERLIPLAARHGRGRDLARVWNFVFRRRGSLGSSLATWRARVDAATGEILEFQDVNAYAQVTGGVHPSSYVFSEEIVLPMPYADLSSGGYANSAGQFTLGSDNPSSTLTGKHVDISDSCGPISQSANTFGSIAFGTSGGTDCATPGSGGGGNTHAARTQFYHLNRILEVGRGWLPSNSWLASRLPVNVNLKSTCNAFWNGSSLNFYRSGSGCGNTGEIAAVSLHEYGHGLDSNDGSGFSTDGGTGEAYADVTAALMLRDSCIGPGFRATNCGGYGDACTSCTGVRDIDWARHASNAPHTVESFIRPRCGGGNGACGRQVHCESHVASEAIWDLATRDLPDPGSAAAWATVERLWYLSRPTATTAFTCYTASIPWASNGCSAGSWWRALRAADDDDGNLANGTPHSCHLFAAFNRHGMACADPGANVCFSGCAPPAQPAVGLTAGDHKVTVSWTSSGPGAVYDVFRSEAGCGAGFVKVADGLSGTSFADTGLANGLEYSYQVVAHAAGNDACAAPPTECGSATPQPPPCPGPTPAPTGLAAVPKGSDRIAVSWNAVPGAVAYDLYRSTTSGGPWSLIRTVIAPTTSHLDTGLQPGTKYSYVVRAAATEECVSATSPQVSATTIPCQTVSLYGNGFEEGADWTVESLNAAAPEWPGVQTCAAHGGGRIFRFGGESCGGTYAGGQLSSARPRQEAGFAIPAGSSRARLSFWHRRLFEEGYDGGTLKLSLDGDAYHQVPATALSGLSYNGLLYHGCLGAEPSGTPIFTGALDTFGQTEVDLDAVCDAITGSTGASAGCAGHTLRIGFNAMTDCINSYEGWFLDDVEIAACVPHGCTGAPAIGTATAPAHNQVRLSWNNGAPASSSFNIYRAKGTCASHGPFVKIATAVGASPYLDSPVSGGTSWAYQVAGLDASGTCESDRSPCLDVAATGPCMLPPVFAGLDTAADAAADTCSAALSWPAATPSCGETVSYDVFRSTDPSFAPSPANRIASGVAGTSFQDAGTLQYGRTYHYVVRAVSSSSGMSDSNTVRRSVAPTGPLTMQVTLPETFEAADGFVRDGWTNTSASGPFWIWNGTRSQSPSHSWHSQAQHYATERILTSPPIQPGSGGMLTFWHTYEFEECFDGGTLEVSENGSPWASVPASAFVTGGYTGQVFGNGNPISGRPGWCRGTLGAMTPVQVSLAPWEGRTIRVRWRAGDDDSDASPGWYLDSVTFHEVVVDDGCSSPPPSPPADFYSLAPCRLLDTRTTDAPALQPGKMRTFQIAGSCGVPATAKALSVNVTAIDPGATGDLLLFRSDQAPPLASSISFRTGVTRSNNVLISISPLGEVSVQPNTPAPLHLALDVNGYFQ